ncbi:MAG TPA: amidohydrolase [Symbiobacteriaceae bacterium]|nr:amidohydrolase [Symbiobacteriaceae bacterium]
MAQTPEELRQLAAGVHAYAVSARRHLHQNPELSFHEQETSAFVAAELRAMGYEPETGVGGHGVRLVVRGARPGPTIALRADMDALPIHEETGLPFASRNPGVMHACGHDMHTATLLATAKAVKAWAGELTGNLVFLFQPAEESLPGGAKLMIEAGALQNPNVEAIFGLHVIPSLPVGQMEFGSGPVMAAPDSFRIVIRGKGGHAAFPHEAIDPVLAAGHVIVQMQQVVSRNLSPFQQAVIGISTVHGGKADNVIPDEVELVGTVRSLDPAVRAIIPGRIEAVVRGVCESVGTTYTLEYQHGYPPVVNTEAETAVARSAAQTVLGLDQVGLMLPVMGGEDFSFYLEQVPGSFGLLGARPAGEGEVYGLHTSRLFLDEAAMRHGVAYYLGLIQHYLA